MNTFISAQRSQVLKEIQTLKTSLTLIDTKILVLEELTSSSSALTDGAIQLLQIELKELKKKQTRFEISLYANELIKAFMEGAMTTDVNTDLPTCH